MQGLGGRRRTVCAEELHTQKEGSCMMRMQLAMNEGTSSERHSQGFARGKPMPVSQHRTVKTLDCVSFRHTWWYKRY